MAYCARRGAVPEFIYLTGRRFDRLYVIGLADQQRYAKPAWD
jgi:hypothetical protein